MEAPSDAILRTFETQRKSLHAYPSFILLKCKLQTDGLHIRWSLLLQRKGVASCHQADRQRGVCGLGLPMGGDSSARRHGGEHCSSGAAQRRPAVCDYAPLRSRSERRGPGGAVAVKPDPQHQQASYRSGEARGGKIPTLSWMMSGSRPEAGLLGCMREPPGGPPRWRAARGDRRGACRVRPSRRARTWPLQTWMNRRGSGMGCIGLLAVVLMLCVDGVGASEFWSGVTPSEAIIGRNTTFTLDVTGLLTGEEVGLYTCQFRTSLVDPLRGEHLDLSSPVRVLSPTSAECDAPEWDLPGVDAVLDLYKGDWSLSKKGWPAVVAFRPVALSIAPQVGIAAGGYNLTVAGLGFYEDADEPYRIVLTGRNRTVEGGTTESVVSEPCVVTEKSTIELICVAPPWPSAAEATQVALRLGDVEVLLDGPMGSMLFNYTPSCSGFSTRVADAVRRINVSIAGHGFGLDEPASCRFLPVNGGGGAVTSAVVHGPGAISCPTPVWSEPGCVSPAGCGQNATLELLLGESLTCADESGSFAFTSVWAGATPTRGLASGGYLLTVTGGGFDLDSDQIACQFTCGGATFLSQRTRPRDPATVVCNVPQAPRLPCVANLVLVQGGSLIASNGSAVAFTFQHVWNSASRTAAPAVGGAFISLRGVFDPAATYVCVFASESLRNSVLLRCSLRRSCSVRCHHGQRARRWR